MSLSAFFSANYQEARGKFLSVCATRNLQVESIVNPNAKGPTGEDLCTDIALIGPSNASKFLLITSGTHGVEGYCGSGVQVGLLQENYFKQLPADTAVLMIHAVNPYGFAHDRRVNEDNIDLNRNYIDHEAARALPSKYPSIQSYILPDDWDGPDKKRADEGIAKFIDDHGMFAFQAAASGGQYHYPDGIFFGGEKLAWSWKMLQSVLTKFMGNANLVGAIDIHTGLGPYGYGELIGLGPTRQKELSKTWYPGQVTDPDAGTSTSAPVTGTVGHGVADILCDASIAFIALEYGTLEPDVVLDAIRADNWLYQKGDVDSDLGREIKTQVREAFYGDTDEWKMAVWTRACEVVDMTLKGLEQSNQ
nr:M14 family metallopeptidase [Hyphomonas sp. Mor2]